MVVAPSRQGMCLRVGPHPKVSSSLVPTVFTLVYQQGQASSSLKVSCLFISCLFLAAQPHLLLLPHLLFIPQSPDIQLSPPLLGWNSPREDQRLHAATVQGDSISLCCTGCAASFWSLCPHPVSPLFIFSPRVASCHRQGRFSACSRLTTTCRLTSPDPVDESRAPGESEGSSFEFPALSLKTVILGPIIQPKLQYLHLQTGDKTSHSKTPWEYITMYTKL